MQHNKFRKQLSMNWPYYLYSWLLNPEIMKVVYRLFNSKNLDEAFSDLNDEMKMEWDLFSKK